jgi:nucleoside-diphosphate-sugar epimerase
MRVFVTGATGLVGNAVAAALKARHHDVIALVRTHADADRLRALGYQAVLGDTTAPETWQKQAASADAHVHAAFLRPGKRLGRRWVRNARAADRQAFRALVHAAEAGGGRCKALCYTSGISIFGDHGDAWIDESAALRPGAIGAIKRAGEEMVADAFKAGLPAFSLRPGLVYAPSGVFRDFFLKPAARGQFSYIGSGTAYHSTVSVGDLAQAYCLAIENPIPGEVLNAVDDKPLRWLEFAELLLKGFGGGRAKPAPPWLVSIFAGQPLVEMLTASYRVRNDTIKKRLGWQPRYSTLADGLLPIIAEYKRQ